MPNLAGLAANGVEGPLRSVLPPLSLPAWPSFATGTNPGKHGIYSFYTPKSGGYNMRPFSSQDIRGMTIWDYLDSIGKTSYLVNMPLTYPPYEINGVMVSGFPGSTGKQEPELYCFPESVAAELGAIAPHYKIEADNTRGFETGDEDQILEILCETLRERTKVVLHLLRDKAWELFIAVFTCTDRVQHMFWRHMDPNHPAATPLGRSRYGNVIDEFFQAVDEVLGSMLELVDERTTSIVVSDHGHSAQSAGVGVDQLLADIGMLKYSASNRLGFTQATLYRKLAGTGLLRLAQQVIPKKIRSKIPTGIDFAHSMAYCYGFGAINVNLKGREPAGFVEKDDYERVREELSHLLLSYVDPSTGKPIVAKVYRREEIYRGDKLNLAPDILAVFHDGYGPRSWNLNGKAIQRIDAREYASASGLIQIIKSGSHHWFSSMDGIFFAGGNAIKQGARLEGAQLIDVAPTILHLLSVPIPKNMDGRILEIFHPASEPAKRPVEFAGEVRAEGTSESPWSREEEEAVMKRLADLGYMG